MPFRYSSEFRRQIVDRMLAGRMCARAGSAWPPRAEEALVEQNQRADRSRRAEFLGQCPERAVAHRHRRAPDARGQGLVLCLLDIYSRKVVGWAVDRRRESVLVNDALSMATQVPQHLHHH